MSGTQDENPPPPPPQETQQTPTQQTPHTVSTIKLPILKKGEYDIWAMKMEHYLAHTDYPIWEVIQNGNGPVSVTTDTSGQIKILPPKTGEEIVARERERKARTTLLMAIPEDHLAKFHKMTDAKEMWNAIKSRFGGNDESKKMQKYILKQQFEGFTVSNTDGIHKGYERFQSLLSQLEIHGAGVSTEDANQKFLRSLPSAWLQVSLIMRNKPGMDSLSFDDLYNNLRVFENDVKGSTASSSNLQNVAFVSENTSSTNDVSTAYGVSNTSGHNSKHEQTSSYSLLASQSSCPQLDHEDLDQVDEYDLEEMDLKWQVAMISMRIKTLRQSKRAEGKNRLIKAVQSSFHVSMVPSLSSSSQDFTAALDENQILLKVHENICKFHLEIIVPLGGLACLNCKATFDELTYGIGGQKRRSPREEEQVFLDDLARLQGLRERVMWKIEALNKESCSMNHEESELLRQNKGEPIIRTFINVCLPVFILNMNPRRFQKLIEDESWVDECKKELSAFEIKKLVGCNQSKLRSFSQDEEASDVDVHLYRSMLVLDVCECSRPDIMFQPFGILENLIDLESSQKGDYAWSKFFDRNPKRRLSISWQKNHYMAMQKATIVATSKQKQNMCYCCKLMWAKDMRMQMERSKMSMIFVSLSVVNSISEENIKGQRHQGNITQEKRGANKSVSNKGGKMQKELVNQKKMLIVKGWTKIDASEEIFKGTERPKGSIEEIVESTVTKLATKGVLGEVVTTCERSQVRVSLWGFSFKVGIYRVLPHRCADSRLAGTTFWGMYCGIESFIIIRGWQGLPSR
ncbi:hypothetical protein Tco_0140542 [Tanacetum coccineum]